ncbi:MAG: hypothetical protein H6581_11020 [Bacteroidia bacterium]|nr:hypothetical protein [Bacteroidia bacterium]
MKNLIRNFLWFGILILALAPLTKAQNAAPAKEIPTPKMEAALVVLHSLGNVSIHISGQDIQLIEIDQKELKNLSPEEKFMAYQQHLLEVIQEMLDEGWVYAGQSGDLPRITFIREKKPKKEK